jgi:hypothetical protein
MNKWSVAAAVALTCAALHSSAKDPIEPVLKAKGWFTAYEAARAEARRSGKPLFVVFRCQP